MPDKSQLNGYCQRAMDATAVKKLDFGPKNVYRLISVPKLPSHYYQVHIMSGGKTKEFRIIIRTLYDDSLAVLPTGIGY